LPIDLFQVNKWQIDNVTLVILKEAKNRDFKRIFRVKGIYLQSTYDIRSILEDHNELRSKDSTAELSIKSLAIEAHGRSRVATISFKSVPTKLISGHKWTLDIADSEQSAPGGSHPKRALTINDHFHGLTVLYSPPPEKHKVEYVNSVAVIESC
jgi:hypothetical protein